MFLSIRNVATCFSLGFLQDPVFSRNSARCLGEDSIPISAATYAVLERGRILSTRGYGATISEEEIRDVIGDLDSIDYWMAALTEKAGKA